VKGNVSLAQASIEETVLRERIQEALGQLAGAAKEGLLGLSVGVGLGVLAEQLMGRRSRRRRRPEGQAQRATKRGASRARVGRGNARRPTGRGGAAAGTRRRWRRGGAACDLRALRFAGRARAGGDGANAGERLDASLRAHRRAGRLGGRGEGTVDVEVVGVAHVC
jgi:hypothetical protein